MWYLYSLFSLLAWSGSDLFSKLGSKADDKYSHWKMVMAVGLVMGLHAAYEMIWGGVAFDARVMLRYLPASLMYILSMILGYAGLRYIELSVSSPICNSSGAVAAILCFAFLGERAGALQGAGIACACVGVTALAVVERRAQTRVEAPEARKYQTGAIALLFPLLYCLIDGLGTFADAIILESLDERQANVAYELTFLAMAAFAFVYVVIVKKQRLEVPREAPKLLAALCETAGQFTYVFAIAEAPMLAAPVIASYSVLSVLWSRIFLKEKLTPAHYAAILVTFAGIAILGFEG